MPITQQTAYNNSRLIDTRDFVTRLKADPSITSWASSRNEGLNLVGSAVAQLFELKSSGVAWQPPDTPNRPALVAGAHNSQAGLLFDGSNDNMQFFGAWTRTAPWSLAIVYRAFSGTGLGGLLTSWDNSAQQSGFIANTDTLEVHQGTGVATLYAPRGAVHVAMGGFDGQSVWGRIDSNDFVLAQAAGTAGVQTPTLGALNSSAGAPFSGQVFEVWVGNGIDWRRQSPQTISLIERYCRAPNVFNLSYVDPLAA